MKAADKHYKFVNSETGYVIFYHSISCNRNEDEIKAELENVKAQVAIKNNLFVGTIFWQELKEGEENHHVS
jgi:hypothetical protein